ncbi:transmembrane and immunoglobulin domain-containing protein 2 isoform X2 [Camelus bactrianus]|uniref:transmembrane and immunoglobulin domain-containing protein 2 isoform X2 n=1 Tax=Camelus bactrianus TaxID=9837 RepID=UPI003D6E1303
MCIPPFRLGKKTFEETEARDDRKWSPKQLWPPDVCRLAQVSHRPLWRGWSVTYAFVVGSLSNRRGSGGGGEPPRRGGPDGPGMGSPGTMLVLLVQLWALQGATGLSVQQAPKVLQVRQDSRVTLACQVVQAPAWERLHVEWTKDGDTLCQTHITNSSLSVGGCGPWGRLSWWPPGHLTLQLDRVGLNDSGSYVCWATMEIPELEEAQGNGTQLLVEETDGSPLNLDQSFSGLFLALLVTGAVAVAAFALGAWIWGRRRRRHTDAGNPVYSNVLYRPWKTPKKSEAWSVEGKVLDIPREDENGQSFYLISFPQPPTPKRHVAPKSCPSPRPSPPISTVRVSPGPGSSGQPRPRAFPGVGRGIRTPRPREGPPAAVMDSKRIRESSSPA